MRLAVVLSCLTLLACPSLPDDDDGGVPKLPPLSDAPLATQSRWVATHAVTPQSDRPTSSPQHLNALLDEGFGDVEQTSGISRVTLTLDGQPAPAPGANRKLLLRFVHLADTQLTDDESPSRMVSFDSMSATAGAYRPQEAWGCHGLNAAVRTINKLHETTPIGLVVLGGDNADNAQANEAGWFRSILSGAPSVECDSGDDDDPEPGPGNDPKDAFFAPGLDMPWRWVTGNHDILNQGNFRITDEVRAEYVGTDAPFGTRDWSRPGAPTVEGAVIADSRRAPLVGEALLDFIAEDGDGHGLRQPGATTDGKAFYAIDIDGAPLRLVMLDTAAPTGGADGVLWAAEVEARVRPLLEEAETQGRYVLLFSHHAARALTDGSGFGGAAQTGTLTPDAWRAFLGQFPHVVAHIGAHSHDFRTSIARPSSGNAFYETESASLTDWPQQLRLFEVWDEDNGTLHIAATPFDYAEENDALAAQYRRRAAADFTSGWFKTGAEDDGAIDLWFPLLP